MSKTIQEQLTEALQARGFAIDTGHRTRKYVVMKPTAEIRDGWQKRILDVYGMDFRLFLGKAGAFRFSRSGNSTQSTPWEKTKSRLLSGTI